MHCPPFGSAPSVSRQPVVWSHICSGRLLVGLSLGFVHLWLVPIVATGGQEVHGQIHPQCTHMQAHMHAPMLNRRIQVASTHPLFVVDALLQPQQSKPPPSMLRVLPPHPRNRPTPSSNLLKVDMQHVRVR